MRLLTLAAGSRYAVPSIEARHRNRKKWCPQREQRYGETIQEKAFSTALRTPTPLNSIDLQYGQRVDDMARS
jgi:hypothetical protein